MAGLRFAYLGSGSRGNGLLVESADTAVLVDCGFSIAETERRLLRLGREPRQLAAVLVTHEHSDHIQGVGRFARRHGLPVWMTAGTKAAGRCTEHDDVRLFSVHGAFAIDGLHIQPFPVPHDAREPSQFVFGDGARRLGLLTDAGSSTPHIEECLSGLDALVLECNHDLHMLAGSRYSPLLKRRVGGRFGHLSNHQAGALLAALDCRGLQHLVAAHLSQENNTPDLARQTLAAALGCAPEWIAIADQDRGMDWRELA